MSKIKGCKAHVKANEISNSRMSLVQHVNVGTYLTFTLKTQSNNLCYENEYSVLKKKRIRDERLDNNKKKFDYEIVDLDIKILND